MIFSTKKTSRSSEMSFKCLNNREPLGGVSVITTSRSPVLMDLRSQAGSETGICTLSRARPVAKLLPPVCSLESRLQPLPAHCRVSSLQHSPIQTCSQRDVLNCRCKPNMTVLRNIFSKYNHLSSLRRFYITTEMFGD